MKSKYLCGCKTWCWERDRDYRCRSYKKWTRQRQLNESGNNEYVQPQYRGRLEENQDGKGNS